MRHKPTTAGRARENAGLDREPGSRPPGPIASPPGLAPRLLLHVATMSAKALEPKLIAVRHLHAGGRTIQVDLFRNERGSVAARCHLGAADKPIIDGPSEAEVLAAVADAMDGLLLARATS